MRALGLVVSEKRIFYIFIMTPPGRGPCGPQGHGWQDYKEEHYILLHTKYESSGPCGFGEEVFFYVLPMTPPPRGVARMDPRGTVGRIYKEDHYTLLLTKYESSGPCGFGEEDFFMFFPL